MTFAHPQILWLLLVFPPAMVAFFWWSFRKRGALMIQFIQARLLPGLISGVSPTREKVRAAGLILAVICLILALARPQWGVVWEEVKRRGLDIVVAIDTSKSMLAEDIGIRQKRMLNRSITEDHVLSRPHRIEEDRLRNALFGY